MLPEIEVQREKTGGVPQRRQSARFNVKLTFIAAFFLHHEFPEKV